MFLKCLCIYKEKSEVLISYLLLSGILLCSLPKSLYSFSEIVSVNVDRGIIRGPGYNPNRGISKGYMKFNYDGNIVEVDFGNYNENTGVGTVVENGKLPPFCQSNAVSKSSKKSQQDFQSTRIKKDIGISTDANNRSLHHLNEHQNFSQYIKLNWQRPWNAPLGQTFMVFASTQSEFYQDSLFAQSPSDEKRGDVSIAPKTGVEWSGPFIPIFGNNISLQPSGKLIAELPKALGSASPLGGYSLNNTSGEGMVGTMLNGANNNPNSTQFQGGDVIEGSRAIYGGKIITTLDPLGTVNLSLGQRYYLLKQSAKNEFQGTSHRFSDYIGHLEATPLSWLSLNYRFQLSPKSLTSNLSEVGVTIGPPVVSLSGTYVVMHKHNEINTSENFKTTDTQMINNQMTTKQINLFLTSQVTDNWFFMSSLMQDLQKKQKEGKAFQYGVGADYHNDRFRVGLTVNRQFYPGIGSKPGTLFMLTFSLNNEGVYVPIQNRNAPAYSSLF